ncbi:MAG TPA: hypothetical protein VMV09_09085, partial [Candidatus Saccharimonadales bacterium]|nr:hypothetical protein [Candidatus Saccharimonadales bacterium]
ITEIADLFAVNKADLEGVDRVVRELRDLVRAHREEGVWRVPVIPTVASKGAEGVADLATALDLHRAHLVASGTLTLRAERRRRDEVVELVGAFASEFARRVLSESSGQSPTEGFGSASPESTAEAILARLAAAESKMVGGDPDPTAETRRNE